MRLTCDVTDAGIDGNAEAALLAQVLEGFPLRNPHNVQKRVEALS
jgi:hypothetical protein